MQEILAYNITYAVEFHSHSRLYDLVGKTMIFLAILEIINFVILQSSPIMAKKIFNGSERGIVVIFTMSHVKSEAFAVKYLVKKSENRTDCTEIISIITLCGNGFP